jgi:hypothetical protein
MLFKVYFPSSGKVDFDVERDLLDLIRLEILLRKKEKKNFCMLELIMNKCMKNVECFSSLHSYFFEMERLPVIVDCCTRKYKDHNKKYNYTINPSFCNTHIILRSIIIILVIISAKIRHGMARQGRTWNDKAWQGKARKYTLTHFITFLS